MAESAGDGLGLVGTSGNGPGGGLIAAVDADVEQLIASEQCPPAMHGVAEQMRVLARALVKAIAEDDTRAAARFSSELRQTRALLAAKEVQAHVDDFELGNFLASLRAAIRDQT